MLSPHVVIVGDGIVLISEIDPPIKIFLDPSVNNCPDHLYGLGEGQILAEDLVSGE
jgi:hypothetical protein